MKVYHGSLEIVTNPEIRISDRTLDYGSGFYTTTDYAQARSWVERRKNDGVDTGYINVYEISNMTLILFMALLPMTRSMRHSLYLKTV